jgi:hypothetical protein
VVGGRGRKRRKVGDEVGKVSSGNSVRASISFIASGSFTFGPLRFCGIGEFLFGGAVTHAGQD